MGLLRYADPFMIGLQYERAAHLARLEALTGMRMSPSSRILEVERPPRSSPGTLNWVVFSKSAPEMAHLSGLWPEEVVALPYLVAVVESYIAPFRVGTPQQAWQQSWRQGAVDVQLYVLSARSGYYIHLLTMDQSAD